MYITASHSLNSMYNDYNDALILMGFKYLGDGVYRRVDILPSAEHLIIYATINPEIVEVSVYLDSLEQSSMTFITPLDLIDHLESVLNSNNVSYMEIVESETILCASNSRDMASKLMRVKSSNVWSYAFNPKDNRIGDMLMQFKNKEGGAGDIYIYYDVPSKVWRQLVGAPSKGHAFWKLIRNVYTYAKLTGDKRTHLPNGI